MSIFDFDPNTASLRDAGLYGLPFSAEESDIIIIPVNWELTVSYRAGTFGGPEAVKEASMQMDLYHHDYPQLWKKGIFLDEFPDHFKVIHAGLRKDAITIIEDIESGKLDPNKTKYKKMYEGIRKANEDLMYWLRNRIAHWRLEGKTVGLLGGDHSIPLAYHAYMSDKQPYGILHIDAHLDLRNAYEGFQYSHASIFFNALKFNTITKLVSVGIRDYCEEEVQYVQSNAGRIEVFYDRDLRTQLFEGKSWRQLSDLIVAQLPDRVYVSVDIDGLDPKLCPNTGTPVPGGLDFEELMYLFNRLKASGKEIVGFDLCEVAPGNDQWDGNVGARVLYQLCGLAAG